VTGEWTVFWEVALIVLLFVAIGGVLAMPALDGIRVRVDDDQLSRPERRR
jgi:Na+/proline symporter